MPPNEITEKHREAAEELVPDSSPTRYDSVGARRCFENRDSEVSRIAAHLARHFPSPSSSPEIEGIVERLRDMRIGDVEREGFVFNDADRMSHQQKLNFFGRRWDALDAKRGHSWESNPWVWVISFQPLKGTPE